MRVRILPTFAVVTAFVGATVALLAASPAKAPAAEGLKLPLRLTAFAVSLGAGAPSRAGTVTILIERWSTDAQRDRLLDALVDGGSSKLLSTVQSIKPRAGSIATPNRLGWDIQYARLDPGEDGGWHITFGSDRPMPFWELRESPRTRDYEFMFGEIHLNSRGVGEGKLATPTKIDFDKKSKRIEIEHYASEPARLTEVRVER
jgi:hypothetical protein